MSLFSWLSTVGTSKEMDDDTQNKVRLSNYLTVSFIVIIIAYSIICFFVAPEIFYYCLAGLGLYLINLLMSYLGFHRVTRIGSSLFPPLVIAMLQAVIMQEGDLPIKETYAFQVVACLIPFTVFDIRKVGYWLPPFLVAFSLVLFVEDLNAVFAIEFDNQIFQETWLRWAIVGGAVAIGIFLIVFLKYLNLLQFSRAKELLAEIEKENQNAAEKENALKKTLEDLETAQKEEQKRNWQTTGLAEIGNLLRVESELDSLTDKIIAYIVKYMKANQGALYLLDDQSNSEHPELYIKSAYAYERKKRLAERVMPGEGLVGQCFLEKDFIYLTDVPDGFITIRSGLGDANPKSILITPMLVNEEIYGVFEVASFNEFEEYQIDFMMELGENIAMTLNNFKVNEKTKKLLDETQEQSEQLRSQEEEMRQNMEELQATQEEQERQQKELLQKIEVVQGEKQAALDTIAKLER
ncbi:MAG: GAF domain-containing protein [Marivirga sp.]|jgi:GAF domain-containing protein